MHLHVSRTAENKLLLPYWIEKHQNWIKLNTGFVFTFSIQFHHLLAAFSLFLDLKISSPSQSIVKLDSNASGSFCGTLPRTLMEFRERKREFDLSCSLNSVQNRKLANEAKLFAVWLWHRRGIEGNRICSKSFGNRSPTCTDRQARAKPSSKIGKYDHPRQTAQLFRSIRHTPSNRQANCSI